MSNFKILKSTPGVQNRKSHYGPEWNVLRAGQTLVPMYPHSCTLPVGFEESFAATKPNIQSTTERNDLHICGDKNTELERHQQNTERQSRRNRTRAQSNNLDCSRVKSQRNRNNLQSVYFDAKLYNYQISRSTPDKLTWARNGTIIFRDSSRSPPKRNESVLAAVVLCMRWWAEVVVVVLVNSTGWTRDKTVTHEVKAEVHLYMTKSRSGTPKDITAYRFELISAIKLKRWFIFIFRR